MSDANSPGQPTVRRKISAFASALQSTEVTAQITYRDVQRIKPGLPREKAEAFLRIHAHLVGEAMLNAGLLALIACLDGAANEP